MKEIIFCVVTFVIVMVWCNIVLRCEFKRLRDNKNASQDTTKEG